MGFSERRLPHWYEVGARVFVTWSLYGSLPSNRGFAPESMTSGRAFIAMDRVLHQTRTGSFYLRQVEIAEVVLEALYYSAEQLRRYTMHAFVNMPNHVHLL